jgi:hypothetical protein
MGIGNPSLGETTMSRTVILSLATAASFAVISLASGTADARGFGGGGGFGGGHFGGGSGHFASSRSFGGSHFSGRGTGGRNFASARNPGRGGHPGHPGHHWAGHHRGHWIFRNGGWIEIDGVDGVDGVDGGYDAVPVAASTGPCTCLTKNYTPDGLVVFADVCTKEAASARVDGAASDATPAPAPSNRKSSDATPAPAPAPVAGSETGATQAPTSPNYAGRTYQDYLAANPQAATTAKN